jgi:hypothetical protein
MDYWYRRVHSTSWIAYDGDRAIWEAASADELLSWLRERGIEAEYRPLRIARIG